MRKTVRINSKNTRGFTLIEVMLAISIFGLLLLYASQFMRSEINVFRSVSRQNEVEQKARSSMMHILDEVRLNNFTFYKATSNNQGIYRYADAVSAATTNELNSTCLIFINLQPSSDPPPSSVKVLFDYENAEGKLWYLNNGSKYLIADEISKISMISDGRDSHLVKIDITAGGQNGSKPYELLSWIRLY